MNLFILSACPRQCAQWMFDVHIVKIITEAIQMLCVAKRMRDPEADHSGLYGASHVNHPVTIWVRESAENYRWTMALCDAMHDEWKYRFDHEESRVHGAYQKMLLLDPPRDEAFPQRSLTKFAQAMPEEYRCDDSIEAYHRYYQSPDKQRLASWRKRDRPDWFVPDPRFFGLRLRRLAKEDGIGPAPIVERLRPRKKKTT
ncbi:unnamed protein product (mitochondrion) [Plasmodiophora brassicae]|uniref:Uncharacterized protein n=1 Tax=Plasmodiophora brassicae TaxID=37360 RepID=A0A3P3YGL2_PLABS|nr:unnamed protein product [Plasmodiophora brassicae]